MKKLLIFILLIMLAAGFCGCKARSKQQEKPKGARENVIVAESPKLDEPVNKESSSSQEESEPEPDPMPEKQAIGLFEAAKTGKREEIQAYVDYDTLLSLQPGQNAEWIFKLVLANMQGEVLSSEVNDDKAVVFAKLTNVDMGIVLPLYFQAAGELEYNNVFADEPLGEVELEMKYREIFQSLMEKHKNGRIEKLVDINLQKFGEDWTILPDEALGDAMCGGYFTAKNTMTGTIVQFSPPEQSGPAKEVFDEELAYTQRPSPSGDGGGVFDSDILH